MARRRQKSDRTIEQVENEYEREAVEANRDIDVKLANFRGALQDKRTRMLIWEILGFTGLYDINALCDNSVFFSEGKRAVGQEILLLLNSIDVSMYANMIKENISYLEEQDA
jgi:hypothetical protein